MPEISIGRLRGGWCVYWTEGGRRRRYRLAARSPAEAEAEAVAVYRRHAARDAQDTVAALWRAYRAERAGRRIAANMEWSGRAVLPFFGAWRPDDITTARCRDYAAQRRAQGRQDGTIWTELGHLRTVLLWATRERLIPRAPHIERPTPPAPRDRYLTRAEIAALLDAEAAPHVRLAVVLMLALAARVTAVLELTWDRVDLQRRRVDLRTTDTGPRKGRAVLPLNDMAMAAMTVAREAALSDHVIEWAGGPVRSIKKGVAGMAARAGLADVTPHVLRHTAAVHMAEAGVSMDVIAQYLGHSDSRITARVYARFSPSYLAQPAEVLNFGRFGEPAGRSLKSR